MKILVTGFEPFDGLKKNPTADVLAVLPKRFKSHEIYTRVCPVVYKEAAHVIQSEIDGLHPDVILMLGYASNRTTLTIERVAINVMDARIPDNQNNRYHHEHIIEEGPVGYFTTLDLQKSIDALNGIGIKTTVSNTAGTYVCNDVMYQTCHYIACKDLPIRAGFIHVPPYINNEKVSLETLKDAILKLIEIHIKREG